MDLGARGEGSAWVVFVGALLPKKEKRDDFDAVEETEETEEVEEERETVLASDIVEASDDMEEEELLWWRTG